MPRREVQRAGARALVVPADVADSDQVFAAAARIEEEAGPIDVWVNSAFTSVFAPFTEIKPAEFRRVTEVSYLGYVYATMAALQYMRPRDRGTIVQVGSALAYRGIPLQIGLLRRQARDPGLPRGAALRAAARQEQHPGDDGADARGQHPAVRLGAVPAAAPRPAGAADLPAGNGRPRGALRRRPSRAAASTGWARPRWARWPRTRWRRACWTATWPAPASRPSRPTQPQDPDAPANLWEPADGPDGHDFGAHGDFDDTAHRRDAQLWASQHHGALAAGAGGLLAAAAALLRRASRSS